VIVREFKGIVIFLSAGPDLSGIVFIEFVVSIGTRTRDAVQEFRIITLIDDDGLFARLNFRLSGGGCGRGRKGAARLSGSYGNCEMDWNRPGCNSRCRRHTCDWRLRVCNCLRSGRGRLQASRKFGLGTAGVTVASVSSVLSQAGSQSVVGVSPCSSKTIKTASYWVSASAPSSESSRQIRVAY
jgi:hypothetical protein